MPGTCCVTAFIGRISDEKLTDGTENKEPNPTLNSQGSKLSSARFSVCGYSRYENVPED
jgi:hypothetical protein